jgi:hypothetical protein
MPMDFNAVKDKARKMIHDDAKKDAHIIRERQRDRNNTKYFEGQPNDAYSNLTSLAGSSSQNTITESYVDDSEDRLGAAMDSRMKNFMENRQMPQMQVQTQTPTMVNKGLPREILESFSNNYIDQSVFDPNRSVLDRIGVTNGQQQITETVQTYQPVQQTAGGNVDYELIKSIVESAVKKYVNALGKKVITENNDLSMIQVGEKKINLVTKAGDVYEATLIKKYNVKDKAGRN